MTKSNSPSESMDLGAHARFLRLLAHRLIREEGAAEDLAQDAFVAALEQPPTNVAGIRRWLGAVARNRARLGWRAAERRRRREAVVARPEALPSTDEIAERAELYSLLADAVTALPEPYRNVVHLRFHEGLSIEEIATRSGIPKGTIRSRLHRALELLRQRLDREFGGDRHAWCVVLLGIKAPAVGRADATALHWGSTAAGKKTVAVAGALALGLTALVVWRAVDGTATGEGNTEVALSPSPEIAEPSSNRAEMRGAVEEPAPNRRPTAEILPPWEGTLQTLHPGDRLDPSPTGRLTLRPMGMEDADPVDLSVEAGRWSLGRPTAARYEAVAFRTGAGHATLPAISFAVADGDPQLRAAFGGGHWLHVVDAEGKQLPHVSLAVASGWGVEDITQALVSPGPLERIALDVDEGRSPIWIEETLVKGALWVGALHHTWSKIPGPDHGTESDWVVSPTPAGGLEVSVLGQPPKGWKLRLARQGVEIPTTRHWPLVRAGRLTLPGLPPGTYQAALVADQVVRAEQSVAVRVGATTTVELAVETTDIDLHPSTLRGVCLPAPEDLQDESIPWERAGITIYAASRSPTDERLGPYLRTIAIDGRRIRTDPTRGLRWETTIPAGEYVVELRPFGHLEQVTVPPFETTDIESRLPPLARVTVHLRNPDTNEREASSVPHCRVTPVGRDGIQRDAHVAPVPDSVSHRVLCVPGLLSVELMDSEGIRHETSQIVVSGENAPIAVERRTTWVLVLNVQQEGKILELPIDWWAEVEVSMRDGTLLPVSSEYRGRPGGGLMDCVEGRWLFPESGRVTMRFPVWKETYSFDPMQIDLSPDAGETHATTVPIVIDDPEESGK